MTETRRLLGWAVVVLASLLRWLWRNR